MRMKGNEIKGKIALFSGMILMITMCVPQGEVTATIPDKPTYAHETTVYTYDYNSKKISSDKSDETWTDLQNLPLMYPGDSMVIVGEEIDFSKTGTITAFKGLVFENNGETGVASEGPIEVTKVEEYGRVNDDDHSNEFITGFTITGDDMVKIYSKGGGGYSDESKKDPDDPMGGERLIAYYMNYLNYYTLPKYCSISFDAVYYNNGWVSVGEDVLANAIYEQENPDIIYVEDALANLNEDKLVYSVCRPYIEGFALSTNGTVNQYDTSKPYNFNAESGAPFMAKTIENYYPKIYYDKNSGSGMIGSYDDSITIQFRMDPARTLTLDACGGLIDGKDKVVREDANKNNIVVDNYPTYMTDGTFAPTRDGYEFKGWFKDKDYTKEVTADNITAYLGGYSNSINAGVEGRACRMYAKWEKGGGEDPIENPTENPTEKPKDGKDNVNKANAGNKVTTDTNTEKQVVKSVNTLEVKGKTVTVKYKKLKKKAQSITKNKAFKISDAKGNVTFKKLSGNKKITINKKTGKVTIKKGLKKKTYKIKVLVTAAGDDKFESGSKIVIVKIKIK